MCNFAGGGWGVHSQFQRTKLRTKIEGILPLLTHTKLFPSFSPTNLRLLLLSFFFRRRKKREKEVGRYPLHHTFTASFPTWTRKKIFFLLLILLFLNTSKAELKLLYRSPFIRLLHSNILGKHYVVLWGLWLSCHPPRWAGWVVGIRGGGGGMIYVALPAAAASTATLPFPEKRRRRRNIQRKSAGKSGCCTLKT